MASAWGKSWGLSWGNSWGAFAPPGPGPEAGVAAFAGGGSARRGGGPDAELSLEDYIRRFGSQSAPPVMSRKASDDEAIALLLCALMS